MKQEKSKLIPILAAVAVVLAVTAAVLAFVTFRDGGKKDEGPVVLSGDGFELTNARFAYYFWSEYVYLASSEQPPFDTGMSLKAQWYDDRTTWQQKLTEMAMETARQTHVLLRSAELEHFTLSDDARQNLQAQKAAYRLQAVNSGYEGRMEEFLISLYGPNANEADFDAYLEDTFLATAYSDHLYAAPVFSEQQISAYYDEFADEYRTTYMIRKDDTRACDLRCIFLTGEDSKERAEKLQKEYESDPTEEHFAKLAVQYNEDESEDENGLYRGVVPVRSEESLRDWAFAMGREVGDEHLLEIEVGHVLVYYAAKADTPLWKVTAEQDMRYETYRSSYREREEAAKVQTFPELVDLPVPESLIPTEK